MRKPNGVELTLMTATISIIPLIVWIKYSIGEPQAVWFVNLLFGLN